MQELFYDCPQCGDIGRVSQLSEHPTRPMPTDLGFCPKCGADVENLLSRDQITTVLLDYGDDPEAFFAALPTSEEAGA